VAAVVSEAREALAAVARAPVAAEVHQAWVVVDSAAVVAVAAAVVAVAAVAVADGGKDDEQTNNNDNSTFEIWLLGIYHVD
jgi:hypothetical protein